MTTNVHDKLIVAINNFLLDCGYWKDGRLPEEIQKQVTKLATATEKIVRFNLAEELLCTK